MHTKVIEVHYFTKEKIGLMLQFLFLILLIVFGILYFLGKINFIIVDGILTVLLFIMAFNNKYTFKKKYMTKVYLITAIMMLLSTILEVLV